MRKACPFPCLIVLVLVLVTADPTSAAESLAISQIQAAGHDSGVKDQIVKTRGILTKKTSSGFYLQDAEGDNDPATSDAIFVSRTLPSEVTVGSLIEVEGIVEEATSRFGAAPTELTITQLKAARIRDAGRSQPISPLIIGSSGRLPPTEIIDDDRLKSFDPQTDGMDFWESLEGMLVRINNANVVGPTNKWGEAWIVADGGEVATGMNGSGGITIAPGDFNPERIQVQFEGKPEQAPQLNVGDRIAFVEGVISYASGNFEILPIILGLITPAAPRPNKTLSQTNKHLVIANYNVENLDAELEQEDLVTDRNQIDDDVEDGRLKLIAQHIAQVLGSPDIIALQELQDDDGAEFSDIVSAEQTAAKLIDAISAEGGPRYTAVERAPADDAEGGQPGGNIRVGFLFNADRVSLDPSSVTRIGDKAFDGSRRPLSAIFKFNGKGVRVVNVHLSSKIGGSPLFGNIQPPLAPSDQSRSAQVQAIKRYLRDQPAADHTLVIGDFNAYQFEEPLLIATEGGEPRLADLTISLPPAERWSYIFQGNSQDLDHILIDANSAPRSEFVIVHINAAYAKQASDHDPCMVRLLME